MRHYWTADDGQKRLHHISCDAPGCEATITPHPKIRESGWTKYGQQTASEPFEYVEFQHCPDHSPP